MYLALPFALDDVSPSVYGKAMIIKYTKTKYVNVIYTYQYLHEINKTLNTHANLFSKTILRHRQTCHLSWRYRCNIKQKVCAKNLGTNNCTFFFTNIYPVRNKISKTFQTMTPRGTQTSTATFRKSVIYLPFLEPELVFFL